MNSTMTSAATGKHQTYDGQPRQESSRRSNNHIAVGGLNQYDSELKKRMQNKPTGENMNKVASIVPYQELTPQTNNNFSSKQMEILKNTICKGVSDAEFEIFMLACIKTKLDPFMKQIYAVKRWDGRLKRETMTIQTGIDGYRLIAERTERYAPGEEPSYVYDGNGLLLSATSYIKKQTGDGTWHTVSASAYIDEYCQTITDKQTGEKRPTGMWVNMPRTMLSKCAEAQALRKAFPAEMSGVYTKEEMQQADPQDLVIKISLEQAAELDMILGDCDEKYKNWVYDYLKKQYNTDNLCDLPAEIFERMKSAALKNMEANYAKQKQVEEVDSEQLMVSVQ